MLTKKSSRQVNIAKRAYFGYDIVMKVQKCDDKKSWREHALKQKQSEFLQSWEWGEFQEKVGNKVVRLQFFENGQVIDQVQGFEHKLLNFIKYIYLPKASNLEPFLDGFKGRGYVFARVEFAGNSGILDGYKIFDTVNRQPQNIFVLNLAENKEDELFKKMHSKTRYNIGLAQRKGVEVKKEKNIDVFWKLNEETIGRDKFRSHNKNYYKKMLEMENCYQLIAYFEGEAIASNILIHFGNTLTYLHGASGNKYRNLMAPYLLQLEGIRLAKKINDIYYDFGGVAPEVKDKETQSTCFNGFCWELKHKWTGITRFKVGFGGEWKKYPQAQEIVFKPNLYKLYKLAKKIL